MESRFYQGEGIDIEKLALDMINVFLTQGFTTQYIGNKNQMLIQFKKGGELQALLGKQSALTLTLEQNPGGVLAVIRQQQWVDKSAIRTVGMLFLWPLVLTANASTPKLTLLISQVFNMLDSFVQQHLSNVQANQAYEYMLQQARQEAMQSIQSQYQQQASLYSPSPYPAISSQQVETPAQPLRPQILTPKNFLYQRVEEPVAVHEPATPPRYGQMQSQSETLAASSQYPQQEPEQVALLLQQVQSQTTPEPISHVPHADGEASIEGYQMAVSQQAPAGATSTPESYFTNNDPFLSNTPPAQVEVPRYITFPPQSEAIQHLDTVGYARQDISIQEQDRYCHQCGTSLLIPDMALYREEKCHHCGTQMKPDAGFCSYCGHATGKESMSATRHHIEITWGYLIFSDKQQIKLTKSQMIVGRTNHSRGKGKPDINLSSMLEAGTVSRMHARIENVSNRYLLTDLQSSNTTKVNGKMLENGQVTLIYDGDILQFGKVMCVFKATY